MPNLYIISGCNGAGKTTASLTVLPEMLNCHEFLNADEIAKGLSPINPERAKIEAGRIMLQKIDRLMQMSHDFAFEATLSSKNFAETIRKAKEHGYMTTLIFFWLDSPDLAIARVKTRVQEGGHDVPNHVVIRRYYAGLKNLFELYIPLCDYWMIFDKSKLAPELIAECYTFKVVDIKNYSIFAKIKLSVQDDKKR
ncbi:MAG: zeta toxin family protein [Mangrovibacterium sp.]|nr:zeta toxin family protein [Mangrovibacterium sp.]